jgi:hypothetical protein
VSVFDRRIVCVFLFVEVNIVNYMFLFMKHDFDIEKFLSLDGYATAERQERRKGPGGS